MAKGKKYNVWIAYSDLFANLTTFLFISALGFFAAFGSGLLSPPGWGGAEACDIPAAIKAQLEADNGLLQRVGSGVRGTGRREGCTEYYAIRDFQFRAADSTSFADRNRRPPSREDLQLRICKPIWLAMSSEAFERARGRVTFVGIAQSNSGNGYPASCGARRRDPVLAGFPQRRQPILVISDCRLRGAADTYPVCGEVLRCLATTNAADRWRWCQEVWAVAEGGRQADTACRRALAEEQAKTLFDQCGGAVDTTFPDYLFRRPGIRAIARETDGRREMWGRETDFDSVSRDALSRDLPPDHAVAAQPAGSILVRVQYGR